MKSILVACSLLVGSVAFDDIDGPFGLHQDLLGGSASFITRLISTPLCVESLDRQLFSRVRSTVPGICGWTSSGQVDFQPSPGAMLRMSPTVRFVMTSGSALST